MRHDFIIYLKKHNLVRKFDKQKTLLELDYHHPSLHTELLEPRAFKLHSFRIDRKYRAIFGFTAEGEIEIVDINSHYQ